MKPTDFTRIWWKPPPACGILVETAGRGGVLVAQKIWRGILLLLVAAVLAFTAWMLWPRSLTGTLDLEGREISTSIITSGWEEVRDEGNFYNRPTMDMERYTLPADSEETRAVLDLLNDYTWHSCWDTLTGETSISGIGSLSVTLYDPRDAERELTVYSGTGKIRLNGRIVRLGYFGNGAAETLSRELANLLQSESGVAN